MLRVLQYLLFGHVHEWETVRTGDYKDMAWGEVVRSGVYYDCRCKTCGAYRCFKP